MSTQLTHEEFSTNLNGRFLVKLSPDTIAELDLVEISDFKKSEVQERFWILLRGARSTPLTQGTFTFENDNMGSFEMFMTPIKSDADYLYYEAVFNRLL